jgi:hypothetical protein
MRAGLVLLGWGMIVLFASAQGQAPRSAQAPLEKVQPLPAFMPSECLRNFNPQALSLTWANRRWQIVQNNEVLKDFGSQEHEAREALRLLQALGVNQYGTVGFPPVMEYWLVNGQAPRPPAHTNLRLLPLNPSKLRIDQIQGQWCLSDDQRPLFSFRSRADEARQAKSIIQKYDFSQVGLLGQGSPVMYLFFSRHQGNEPSLATAPVKQDASRQMNPPRFPRLAKDEKGNPRLEKIGSKNNPLGGMFSPVMPPLVTAQSVAPPGSALAQMAHLTNQPAVWRNPLVAPGSAPASAAVEERMAFDHRQVLMLQHQGEWKLLVGNRVLATFSSSDQDARLALEAIRHYHFIERWQVGGEGHPLFCYLANGQSPRGILFGLHPESFEPNQVALKQSESGCNLVAGERVLLRFGERQEEAARILETIQRNKLDRLCKVGNPEHEEVAFLVRSR